MDAEQRRTVGLVGAAAVIVVVVGLVAAFGVERYPDLPPVSAGAEAPGTVAFLSYGRETCLRVAEPDGAVRDLRCGGDVHGHIESEGGRILLHRWEHPDQLVDVIDPQTGDVVATRVADDPDEPPVGASHEGLFPGGQEGFATLRVQEGDDTIRTVLALEGPRSYAFHQARRSPGGEHAVVVDSDQRLLLVSLVGDPTPRLWAEDVGDVVWLAGR